MASDDQLMPREEYQTLRQELLESKRYVFERPLIITAAGIAALGAFKEGQAAPVPLLITGLLLFNLWFTVNRLQSASRIVAYIQLQLESQRIAPWRGWETALRDYRKWLKQNDVEVILEEEMDQEAVPDALMYYPAIHRLHLGIALLAIAGSLFVLRQDPAPLSIACSGSTLLLAAWLAFYAVRYRPTAMRGLIERNRVIWEHVLREMSANPAAGAGG